jgi:hypothetical protein
MKRLLLIALLSIAGACSGSSDKNGGAGDSRDEGDEADGRDVDSSSDDEGTARPPAGKPSADEDDDDDAPAEQPKGGDGLDECASNEVEAERAPRGGNVVWVIDASGSMDEEAAQVQDNLNKFVQSIVAAGLSDYRVVVITESEFVDVPEPLASDTEHFRFIEEEVGSNDQHEILLNLYTRYADFLLKGAVTHFVVVTDDESDMSAQSFVTQMTARHESDFRVHAVASPPGEMAPAKPPTLFGDDDDDDNGCQGALGAAAAPGVQHWEAAKLTDGLTFSICSADWSALFTELAKEVSDSASVPCSLEVPVAPPGSRLDYQAVEVILTAPNAQKGTVLTPAANASGCADEAGWYYDDALKPTSIVLCPTSCEAAAQGGSLSLALGCAITVF